MIGKIENCYLSDKEREKGLFCRGMFCEKCSIIRNKKFKIKEFKEIDKLKKELFGALETKEWEKVKRLCILIKN